jgi:hypothetical protein
VVTGTGGGPNFGGGPTFSEVGAGRRGAISAPKIFFTKILEMPSSRAPACATLRT